MHLMVESVGRESLLGMRRGTFYPDPTYCVPPTRAAGYMMDLPIFGGELGKKPIFVFSD